jgi:hypothetical protein
MGDAADRVREGSDYGANDTTLANSTSFPLLLPVKVVLPVDVMWPKINAVFPVVVASIAPLVTEE